ncbi:MAG: acyltransferase [Novosphingobium sp.]
MTFSEPLPPPSATASARLPGLDMLRGIAALCVLGLHLHAIYRDQPAIFGKGYLAVDLFFMLSGYVMARTYDTRLASGLSPLRFFWGRYRRLWPIMAIGGLLGLPKLYLELRDPAAFALIAGLNLFLLPVPDEGPGFPLNIPAWSILFELTANAVHAAVLWRLGVRWLIALAAATIPLIVWVGLVYGTFDVGAHTFDFFAGLPRVLLSYLIGMVLWRWWRDEPTVKIPAWAAFTAMPLLFASAWLLGVGDWRLDIAFIVIACPLLIAGGLHYRPGSSPGSPWGSGWGAGWGASLAVALGALSFPLYAVHMPVLQGMHLLGYGSTGGALAALAVGIALTIAVEVLARRRKQRRKVAA